MTYLILHDVMIAEANGKQAFMVKQYIDMMVKYIERIIIGVVSNGDKADQAITHQVAEGQTVEWQ
jgi:hypothetical protein